MIQISKQERDELLHKYPDTFVTGTNKHKSNRRKLYVEPTPKIIAALKEIRNVAYID